MDMQNDTHPAPPSRPATRSISILNRSSLFFLGILIALIGLASVLPHLWEQETEIINLKSQLTQLKSDLNRVSIVTTPPPPAPPPVDSAETQVMVQNLFAMQISLLNALWLHAPLASNSVTPILQSWLTLTTDPTLTAAIQADLENIFQRTGISSDPPPPPNTSISFSEHLTPFIQIFKHSETTLPPTDQPLSPVKMPLEHLLNWRPQHNIQGDLPT